MTDDIVTRLREGDPCCRDGHIYESWAKDAADEIERLRADLNNASAKMEAYYQLVQAYRWSHAHLGEWPDAIVGLVAENYKLRKQVHDESREG